MQRVNIFVNGSNENGKVIKIPDSFEELKLQASSKLGCSVVKIFTAQGCEIEDIDIVKDDESLYVSAGEAFIEGNMQKSMHTSSTREQSDNSSVFENSWKEQIEGEEINRSLRRNGFKTGRGGFTSKYYKLPLPVRKYVEQKVARRHQLSHHGRFSKVID